MDFVKDIDLVARADWRIANRVIDLAHIINAVVGSSIHLDHVDVAALHYRLAVHSENGHVDGGACNRTVWQLIVERTREDAGSGGFADAAHSSQNPRLRKP